MLGSRRGQDRVAAESGPAADTCDTGHFLLNYDMRGEGTAKKSEIVNVKHSGDASM